MLTRVSLAPRLRRLRIARPRIPRPRLPRGRLSRPRLPREPRARVRAWAARIPARLLTLAAGLAAAAPTIVSGARAAGKWMPAGDQAIIATRSYDVFTSHTPLLGQYSLVSKVIGHLTYSPGPLLYWLLALPARMSSPSAMAVTIAAMNTLAILASVALARRRGGVGLMLLAALAFALLSRSFVPETLHDTWNPSAGLFPLALLLLLCWSLACGERRLLPATALVASFTVQCELTYLAPCLGALAVGVGGLAVLRIRAARASAGAGAGADAGVRAGETARARVRVGGRVWPWALAALLVLAACWAAPVLDQIEHHPGNFALLRRAAAVQGTTLGAEAGRRTLVRAVGVPPRWLRKPSDPFDSRLRDATTEPRPSGAISCALLLCALLLTIMLAPWSRRWDLAAAALIGLLICAALAAVAARTPVGSIETLGYTLWWGSVAGMWVWLIVAYAGALALRAALTAALRAVKGRAGGVGADGGGAEGVAAETDSVASAQAPGLRSRIGRPLRVLATTLALAAVAAVGAAVASGEARDGHDPEYAPLRAIFARIERYGPRGGTAWVHGSLEDVTEPLKPAVTYALRRQGVRVVAAGAELRLGPWYALDHHPYQYVVYLYDGTAAPPRGARLLARVAVEHEGIAHPLTVSLARVVPRSAPRPHRS